MAQVKPPALEITDTRITYHRNGCTGKGFHVVQFTWDNYGEPVRLFGIVFAEPGHCAVIYADREPQTSDWRGDQFEPALRAAIARHTES